MIFILITLVFNYPSISPSLNKFNFALTYIDNPSVQILKYQKYTYVNMIIVDKLQARITTTLEDGGTIGLDRPSKYSHPIGQLLHLRGEVKL
jgi:hypothetical protein